MNHRTHHQKRDYLKNGKRVGEVIAGAGITASLASSCQIMFPKNPYRNNPHVQKYAALQKRANSLRENLASAQRHPIVRSIADKEAVAGMRKELQKAEAEMTSLGYDPDVLRYEGWSQKPDHSVGAMGFSGLLAILVGVTMVSCASKQSQTLDSEVDKAD